MKRGAILAAAHRDTKAGLVGGMILVVLCLGVLGLNWKYLYDIATGGFGRELNLFVLGAAGLLPVGIVITVVTWRSRMNIERYGPVAALKRYGNPSFVIDAIEKELMTAGPSAHVTPLWIGSSWVVGLRPTLHIFKITDIVAAADVMTPSKGSSPATHAVRVWVAGEVVPTTIDMSEKEARAVLAMLDTKSTGIVHDDAAAFDKRWTQDRESCEREAKTRRTLKRSA
jgi:hypothetical protein